MSGVAGVVAAKEPSGAAALGDQARKKYRYCPILNKWLGLEDGTGSDGSYLGRWLTNVRVWLIPVFCIMDVDMWS
jgi:hypothetical protein